MFILLLRACGIRRFDESLACNPKGHIKRVSLNNQLCQARSALIKINYKEPLYYPFSISAKKYGGSFNIIDDPHPRVCVPNKVKDMNEKVFNLMAWVNERKLLVQHESCECKCGLNESVCHSK